MVYLDVISTVSPSKIDPVTSRSLDLKATSKKDITPYKLLKTLSF
jgi:hypothetical protein